MLSKKDEQILDILRHNSDLSTREISDMVKMPITTVHNRIRKMKSDGIIKKYIAVIDDKKLGNLIQAFIQVSLNFSGSSGKKISQMDLAHRLYQMREVQQCYFLTGSSDMLLQVVVRDVDELNSFIINRLRDIEGIDRTHTSIVLNNVSDKIDKSHFDRSAVGE